ncbi:MAG TPA: thermostable hemolysin [Burkholderiales bacterium]|nr:thermostable hemolysin [Burkholderiales bacterium]
MTLLLGNPRPDLERFIAERFRKVHSANVSHFGTYLLGLRDARGIWRAAAGYTPAASGTLFLEQYLDAPVEEALSQAANQRVPRARIVEVGNLAAVPPGFARSFLPALGRYLIEREFAWVVFTATRQVRNLLHRLCFKSYALAPATRTRLPDGGAAWGTYYANDPTVMAGRLA